MKDGEDREEKRTEKLIRRTHSSNHLIHSIDWLNLSTPHTCPTSYSSRQIVHSSPLSAISLGEAAAAAGLERPSDEAEEEEVEKRSAEEATEEASEGGEEACFDSAAAAVSGEEEPLWWAALACSKCFSVTVKDGKESIASGSAGGGPFEPAVIKR